MTKEELLQRKQKNIEAARLVLKGADAPLKRLIELGEGLQADTSFGYAWKIFARARQKPEVQIDAKRNLELAQKQAVCTYKDPDLPADQRLRRAFEILQRVDDLKTTTNQETLGLAGAISKRVWELESQKQHLERALSFYLRGHAQGIGTDDNGYSGINAAFVLDLLAEQEEQEAESAFTN